MYTMNVPPYSEYWPEDGLVNPKHAAKTVYFFTIYIDVLWLSKQLDWIFLDVNLAFVIIILYMYTENGFI
jgi:hypothetical protein